MLEISETILFHRHCKAYYDIPIQLFIVWFYCAEVATIKYLFTIKLL